MLDNRARWRLNAAAQEAVAELETAIANRPRCNRDTGWLHNAPPRSAVCRWNDGEPRTDYVIWGDSHARMIAPELAATLVNAGLSGGVLVGSPECPPIQGIQRQGRKYRDDCATFVDAVFRTLEREKPRVVIMAARWATYESKMRAPGDGKMSHGLLDLENRGQPIALADALMRTLERLNALGVRTVLVGPVPEIEYDVPTSLVRYLGGVGSLPNVPRAEFDARQRLVLGALERAREIATVTVVHAHTAFCNDERCEVAQGARALYVDDDHLSPFGSVRVVRLIREAICRFAALRCETSSESALASPI